MNSLKERSFIPAFTDEEKLLLKWITEDQYSPSVTNDTYPKIKEQLQVLIPVVLTKQDVKDLCTFIQPKIKGDDKTVYLGNMVTWAKRWAKNRSMNVATNVASQQPLTAESYRALAAEIRASYPVIVVSFDEAKNSLRLHYGKGDNYVLIANRDEWLWVSGDNWTMNEAIRYGRSLQRTA